MRPEVASLELSLTKLAAELSLFAWGKIELGV